ncbi:MAG: hypothetical protein JWO51_1295 [Rhodospirillales bacterium]|nr:hypothetical protein [Rhodospirillales bacterium]
MSLSSTPLTSVGQSAAAGGSVTAPAAVVVVQVLAAYGGDSVRNGLVQTLQTAAGPGNIVSGTISEVRADGTFTLQTKSGAEFSLQRPPGLSLTVGSAVTLRVVAVAPQPQVAILTIDGKLVNGFTTGAITPPPTGQPAAPAASPPLTTALPVATPGLAPATLASTLFAAISLEDEVAIESALSGGGTIAAQAADEVVQAQANSIVATLVRSAPARVGSAPIPAGTRYLATLAVGNADAQPAVPTAARSLPPAAASPLDDVAGPTEPQAASAPPGQNAPQQAAPPVDLTGFKALTTVLAGRVLATSTDSETLVDTAVGTLSIPVQDAPPPIGAAIQLKIIAVAPPEAVEKPVPVKAPAEDTPQQQPLLQEAAQALALTVPALAQQIQSQLSLAPNDRLTSLILNFLGGLKAGPTPARWPDPPTRKALVDAGRSDIATKLDTHASQIGQTRPAQPGDWSITVLPYLGLATTKPMRLYRRAPDEEEQQKGGGERFVIELEMVRLGAMQFDGLVRERRFDLVLRSEKPIAGELKQVVEQTFRDSLLIAGWSGELSYARSGPVPMIPLSPDGAGVGLSA